MLVAAISTSIQRWRRITVCGFCCSCAGVIDLDSSLNLWVYWAVSFHVAPHDVSVHFSNLVVLPDEDHSCDMTIWNDLLVVGQTGVAISSIGDVHGDNHWVASLVLQIHPCFSVLTNRLYAAHPRPWSSLYIVHNLDSRELDKISYTSLSLNL